MANVDKVEGAHGRARRTLQSALKNFHKTRDPRGVIYCQLTLGELDAMESRYDRAAERLQAALDSAASHRFKLEVCHARALLGMLPGQLPTKRGRVPCHASIGACLEGSSIPVHMP
jgi:hypothetical protein